MAKPTKQDWLDALTKDRRFYGRVLNRAKNGEWDKAWCLLDKSPWVFCQLAARDTVRSACKSCPLSSSGLCTAMAALNGALGNEDGDAVNELVPRFLNAYRKARQWARENG